MTDQIFEMIDQDQIDEQLPDWYATWRGRVREWVSQHTDDVVANIVLLVPDLLTLVVRLSRDRRVPFLLKGQLLLAAAYVLSPVDLMPEVLLGVIGLADDAGVLALVLMWLQGISSIDKAVLHDNWPGEQDPTEVIKWVNKRVHEHADKIFSKDVWTSIQARFNHKRLSQESAEPTVKTARKLPKVSLPKLQLPRRVPKTEV